ncbi:hypothetical protein Dimus_004175, partial [Dionaea muscipula]
QSKGGGGRGRGGRGGHGGGGGGPFTRCRWPIKRATRGPNLTHVQSLRYTGGHHTPSCWGETVT